MQSINELPPAHFGSKPTDGGHLIVEPDEYIDVINDPIASKYLRKFRMGRELIKGLQRWCLWLQDVEPEEISQSKVLRQRLERVREMRLGSQKAATRHSAERPHLFAEIYQPTEQYLAIPAVFSDNRKWFTCELYPPEVIAGNKIYTCVDPDGFAFAIISSSMTMTWQDAIGGRLGIGPSFSNTVVWNNLPLPPVDTTLRQKIIDAGQKVLAARALHPERSLADQYNPLAMDPALLKAHRDLDKVVDRAFGATKTCESNEERLKILFKRYQELTAEQ